MIRDNEAQIKNIILNLSDEYKDPTEFINKIKNFLKIKKSDLNFYKIGILLYNNSRVAHAILMFEEMLNQEVDTSQLADCYFFLANSYSNLLNYSKTIEYSKKAIPILNEIGDRLGEAVCYVSLGNTYAALSDYEKAIESLEEAIPIEKEIGAKDVEAECYVKIGFFYHTLFNYPKVIESLEKAIPILNEIGDKRMEVNCYTNLGNTYVALYNYQKAIECYEKSLAIAKEIEDKEGEAKSYKNLGIAYVVLSNYPKAIDYLQKALAIAKEIGDKEWKQDCYINLASAYSELYDYQNTIECYQKALAIAKEIGDKNEEMRCCSNLGVGYGKISIYPKSIDYLQKALAIAKEIGDSDFEADCYVKIGISYHALSNYQKAIEYQEKALAIAKEMEDSYLETKCYVNLAAAYGQLSIYSKTIEYSEKGLAKSKGFDKDLRVEGSCYSSLGNAYHALSNYQKAIEYQEKALAIAWEIGDREAETRNYINLGFLYHALSNYQKSIEYLEKALPIVKERNEKVGEAICYTNLGISYHALSNYTKAIEYQEKALAIAKEIGDRSGEAGCYGNLGSAYYSLYQPRKAIEYQEKALAIAKEIKDKRTEAKCYSNLGMVFYYLSDYLKAVEYQEKALAIAKEIGDKYEEVRCYSNLGIFYIAISKFEKTTGEYEEKAFAYLQKSIDLGESIGINIEEDENKIGFFTQYARLYELIVALCLKLDKKKEAFEYVERSKSKAFIDLMSKSNIKPTKIDYARMNELYQKEQELLMKRTVIQNSLIKQLSQDRFNEQIPKSQPKKIEDLLDIGSINNELNKIYDEMSDIDQEYVSLRRPQHFKLKQAQEFIKQHLIKYNNNPILIEYFLTSEKLYIFLVTKDNLYIEQIPDLNSNNIQDYVDNYEKEVVNYYPLIVERGEQITNNWLYGLSKYLIEPVQPYLQQENIDLICFVPHGILHRLPLHALLLDTQQQQQEKQSQISLIEKYKVVYSSSASLLKFHKSKIDKIQTCKAFGVALKDSEQAFLEEAKRVANLFETVPKLDVTRQEILNTHFTEDVLHFSCHGYFYHDDPLSSGLVFKNEEYLTARDIFANNLKIDSQLVTLSACETGVNENKKGDELIGLTRSFLYSGAQSLVMSLWKVNALAALEIMEEFYNNIKNSEDNHDKASALQKAQITIRAKWKEKGKLTDHPYVWAPFVLVGDWR